MPILDVLKSKKTWISLAGVVVSLGVFAGLSALGVEEGTATKLALTVASLFGIQLTAHFLTDAVSIIKGLQDRK